MGVTAGIAKNQRHSSRSLVLFSSDRQHGNLHALLSKT